jgi:hypothetical protein
MIAAVNSRPELSEFKDLMDKVDDNLNQKALYNPEFFKGKNGVSIEPDIRDVIAECAKGTKFEGTIELVSGQHFPDIIAAKYYGVEVKTTKENHWTSTGSSILESSRIQNVERVFLTFAKLGSPIQFKSRPYEECLSGIAVTHYPRYLIDMTLEPGQTIFDKIGISYEDLRNMDEPAIPVAQYYKSKLRPGESLWWAGDNVDTAAPMTMRMWSKLPPSEKDYYEAQGFVFFPETILSSKSEKYERWVFWLVKNYGIVNSNVRDSFSSGGKELVETVDGEKLLMPAIFRKLKEHILEFRNIIQDTPSEILQDFWGQPIEYNRYNQWINLVLMNYNSSTSDKNIAKTILSELLCDGIM